MTRAFSWQNSISLCPVSFCIPRPNLPVTPGVSWLPTFAFQSPIMKRTFWGKLILKSLVGLHRNVELQLFQRYWLGHRLGLLWYWMVCLGNEQRSFCHFWDCIQVLHFKWTPGVGDGQGGLACYNSRGCKESDTTEWLKWTELNWRKESEMQYLDAISKTTEWSLFVFKANHSVSW